MFAPLRNDIYGGHETNNDMLIGALILEFFVLTLQIADAGGRNGDEYLRFAGGGTLKAHFGKSDFTFSV